MPITKVISGGQTGADQGGIRGAAKAGIETGGWMPFGFLTEDGPNSDFAEKYSLKESEDRGSKSANYSFRTGRNVFDSDGTIRFAKNFSTRGELCTLAAIKRHFKWSHDIQYPLSGADFITAIKFAAIWIHAHEIRVLNVAGNRKSTASAIGEFTERFIFALIQEVNGNLT